MENQTLNKFPVVYIEWCDAFSYSEKWKPLDDLLKESDNDDWLVKEVGFVLKETKEYILFCARISHTLETEVYHEEIKVDGAMKIPTTWVRKRVNLTTHIDRI